MASIRLDSVTIEFPVLHFNARSLKKSLMRMTTGGKILEDAKSVTVKALDNLSIEFNHGDRIGLIGHNGAGKTTLLRILAGIYEPTSGNVAIDGQVSSLMNVMMGIDSDATGYEYIVMLGILYGLSL